MRLRSYTPTDMSAITDIAAVCNSKDALSLYMTRDQDKYWTSYRLGNLRWLRGKIASPGSVSWVVETEEGDLPVAPPSPSKLKHGTVIGWTIWSRTGKSQTARKWQRQNETLGLKLERGLYMLQAKYCDYMPGVNPTWDKQHYKDIGPVLREEWDRKIFAEAWVLEGCYIDPTWQRRGVGSLLVKWGLQQAQEENVPVLVGASPMGLGMYEKNGFRRLKKMGFDQWIEMPGEGCWKLVWEPEGVDGRWLERAVEAEKKNIERK